MKHANMVNCYQGLLIGETHYFDFELFKNCADTNIQPLVKLIEKVAGIYQAIEKVNAIETKEEGDVE